LRKYRSAVATGTRHNGVRLLPGVAYSNTAAAPNLITTDDGAHAVVSHRQINLELHEAGSAAWRNAAMCGLTGAYVRMNRHYRLTGERVISRPFEGRRVEIWAHYAPGREDPVAVRVIFETDSPAPLFTVIERWLWLLGAIDIQHLVHDELGGTMLEASFY
jgi:hypothetical protein